jgi:hypothetical protein
LTPRFVLTEVRVLVQQDDQSAALEMMVGSRFSPQRGTGFHHEVVGKRRTKGRARASHGGLPFPEGKKDPSLSWLL